jgi:hypothetical protein
MLLDEIAKALKQAFGARQKNAEGDFRLDPVAERFPTFTSAHKDLREIWLSPTASIPSLNFIPLTTFGNWIAPKKARMRERE